MPSHEATPTSARDFARRPLRERLAIARDWWNRVGRRQLPRRLNEYLEGGSARAGGGLHGIRVKGDTRLDVRSGILLALEWDQLTHDERLRIVWAYEICSRGTVDRARKDGIVRKHKRASQERGLRSGIAMPKGEFRP